jgi:hypothetical protein
VLGPGDVYPQSTIWLTTKKPLILILTTIQMIFVRTLSATNMSDVREDFDGELNADFWREYIEEKEATRQQADAAFVEDFWKYKTVGH